MHVVKYMLCISERVVYLHVFFIVLQHSSHKMLVPWETTSPYIATYKSIKSNGINLMSMLPFLYVFLEIVFDIDRSLL